jgi:hypothetical protein
LIYFTGGNTLQKKFYVSTALLIFALTATAISQTAPHRFPPEVLQRKASIVGVKTTPDGGTVKVDGVTIPKLPFMLLKKDRPRVLRFEMAGYKPVEKTVDPGAHYVIGIGVDFASHKALLVEFDQPPGSMDAAPAAEAIPVAAPAAATTVAATAEPASAPPIARPAPSSAPANPFGFEFGMTKQQAIAKLGKDAVAKDSGVNVVFKNAPNPHPDFEIYIAAFSPEKGLLKITAVSKDIQTSDDGSELRQKFNAFLSALREKYGKPVKDFDFCKGNDVECGSEYFMMELKEKNRYLNSYWTNADNALPPHLQTIEIEAIAAGINKGYIQIAYEFEGWDAFVDELDKKRNSTF